MDLGFFRIYEIQASAKMKISLRAGEITSVGHRDLLIRSDPSLNSEFPGRRDERRTLDRVSLYFGVFRVVRVARRFRAVPRLGG